MNRLKYAALILAFVGALGVPLTQVGHASAEQIDLQCNVFDVEFTFQTSEGCDLAITKEVSVNGGAFAAADTSDTAATAKVGDTLTWRVTVTDTSEEQAVPFGLVTVSDVVPAGVTVGTVVASEGSYADGAWTFDVDGTLPVTLTVTTTANAVGMVQNTASFADYNPNNCGDNESGVGLCEDPPYADVDSTNNTDSAFVNVQAVPVVATPAVPHTGLGVSNSHPASTLAIFGAATAVMAAGALVSRRLLQK